jgi:2-phospho-L-lactate/phosphoenolpyruvate guanylyltransferase
VIVEWTVLIPLKRLDHAKSRLSGFTQQHRRDVARAMAETVATTAAQVHGVDHVVVVTDEAWDHSAAPALVLPEVGAGGLNAALADAARTVARRWPNHGIAVLLADTAAATADELSACLSAASEHQCSMVADHEGTGTVLLAHRPGVGVEPRFGPGSRLAHQASGALDLTHGLDVPLLRRDLDTVADLTAIATRIPGLPRLDRALRAAGWTATRSRGTTPSRRTAVRAPG